MGVPCLMLSKAKLLFSERESPKAERHFINAEHVLSYSAAFLAMEGQ